MFEKRLKEFSKKMEGKEKEYFVLTHKRNRREIYFLNTEKAVDFMENKFGSFKKKIVYFLIKIGILQPFLKKVTLSSEFGDVVYVANQIKCFQLNEKKVISFPTYKKDVGMFIKSKEFQKKIAKEGYAPLIDEIDEGVPFSKEELVDEFNGSVESVLKKIYDFYKYIGVEGISWQKYKKMMGEKVLSDKKMDLKNFKIPITTLHGDLALENVMEKEGRPVFIDWSPYEGLLTNDLVGLIEKGQLSREKLDEFVKRYFPEIYENMDEFILLSKIYLKK